MRRCKLVAVGDEGVGKTATFMASSRKTRCIEKDEQMPGIQDHQFEANVDDNNYLVCLWDTSGKEKDDELRHLGYLETSVFLVCFDVSKRKSFENVGLRWLPEIRRHTKDVPIMLIANKTDLRQELEQTIRTDEGISLAHKHNMKYMECSSITQEGIQDIIPTAVQTAFSDTLSSKKKSELTSISQKCTVF